MKLLFKLAFKNIINYSKQSKSTLLSIAAAFISLVIFQGYIRDVDLVLQDEHSRRMMLGDFIIENKQGLSSDAKKEPWKFYLTEEQQVKTKEILRKNLANDLPICSALRINGMVQKKAQQFLFIGTGFDVEECRKLRLPHWEKDALYGSSLFMSTTSEPILLGQTLAKNFDCEKKLKNTKNIHTRHGYSDELREFECSNGDQFTLSTLTVHSQINSLDFNLIGIIDGGFIELDARTLQLPLNKAQELYDTKGVSYLSFFSKKLADNPELFKKIESELPDNVRIISWRNHETIGDFYRRAMGLMDLLKFFVVVIVLVIVSLSIMNSLLKNIKERTKEIGTMRSLGYTKSIIRNIFFIEILILSLFGTIIGAALSLAITLVINGSGITYKAGQFVESTPMTIAFEPMNYLFVTFYIFILSLFGCFFVIRGTLNNTVAENLIHA